MAQRCVRGATDARLEGRSLIAEGEWERAPTSRNRRRAITTVTRFVDVDVPLSVAYNQWTQFEDFPEFMDGVERVEQLADDRIRWTASFGGETHQWESLIVVQIPDQRIVWRADEGKENNGTVTFEKLDPGRTRVHLELYWEPEGFKEKLGASMQFDDRRVEKDLHNFKEFIEDRDRATGAYRDIVPGKVPTGPNARELAPPEGRFEEEREPLLEREEGVPKRYE